MAKLAPNTDATGAPFGKQIETAELEKTNKNVSLLLALKIVSTRDKLGGREGKSSRFGQLIMVQQCLPSPASARPTARLWPGGSGGRSVGPRSVSVGVGRALDEAREWL